MKTIIKLVIVALVLTATFQASRAAIRHYTFVDALQEALLFAGNKTEDDVAEQVVQIAGDHEIPLDPPDVAVRRESYLVVVDAPYVATIDLLPGIYKHSWSFDTSVSVRLLQDTRPASRKR
jgi:hypothetical protein